MINKFYSYMVFGLLGLGFLNSGMINAVSKIYYTQNDIFTLHVNTIMIPVYSKSHPNELLQQLLNKYPHRNFEDEIDQAGQGIRIDGQAISFCKVHDLALNEIANEPTERELKVKDVYKNVLTQASINKVKSIVLPIIAKPGQSLSDQLQVKLWISAAVEEWIKDNNHTTIQTILINGSIYNPIANRLYDTDFINRQINDLERVVSNQSQDNKHLNKQSASWFSLPSVSFLYNSTWKKIGWGGLAAAVTTLAIIGYATDGK